MSHALSQLESKVLSRRMFDVITRGGMWALLITFTILAARVLDPPSLLMGGLWAFSVWLALDSWRKFRGGVK